MPLLRKLQCVDVLAAFKAGQWMIDIQNDPGAQVGERKLALIGLLLSDMFHGLCNAMDMA